MSLATLRDLLLLLLVRLQQLAGTTATNTLPRELVDPWIGTGGLGFGVGGNPPGAQRPFGLVKFSPDTVPDIELLWEKFQHYGGANWPDNKIRAFSLTHMAGPGALDLGAVGIMPIGGPEAAKELHGATAKFSHANETATPGYFKVRLTPQGGLLPAEVEVELTATLHTAVMRLTPVAPSQKSVSFLFDPRHCLNGHASAQNRSVEVGTFEGTFGTELYVSGHMLNHGELSGRFGGIDMYFHATFPDSAVDELKTGIVDNGLLRLYKPGGGTLTAKGNVSAFAGLLLSADNNGSGTAVVGVSCVSLEQAKRNSVAQVGTKSFDELVAEAYADWDARMAVVEIGATDEEASNETPFWTALYHTLISPSTYSESGGRYMGFNQANAPPFPIMTLDSDSDRHLSDMSIWDTHRSWNPLTNLLQPDIGLAFARSLVRMIKQGGDLPRWPLASGYTGCMIGGRVFPVCTPLSAVYP